DRRKDVAQHLSELVHLRIDRVSAQVVEDLVVQVATKHPRTAQIVLQTIKMILKDARRRGQRVDERVYELKAPRYEKRPIAFLTLDEVQALAAASTEPRLILFAALTGLRQGELFALSDDDVSSNGSAITVRNAKTAAGRRTLPLAKAAK